MLLPQISLRPVTLQDSPFILELTSDKDWLINIGDRGVSDITTAENYISESLLSAYTTKGLGLMGIEDKKSGELAGVCGLLQRDYFEFPDLGFALLPRFRGLGFTVAAAKQTLQNALASKSKMILATALPSNIASISVLQKLNFETIGIVEINAEKVQLMGYCNGGNSEKR